jgi:hypothetical protein
MLENMTKDELKYTVETTLGVNNPRINEISVPIKNPYYYENPNKPHTN